MKHIYFNTIQANKWVKGVAMLSLTVALQAKSCSSSGGAVADQETQKQTPLTLVQGMVNLAARVPGKQENALFYALGQNKQDVLEHVLERVSKNEINLRNPTASKEAFLQTVHPNGNPPLSQAIQLGKKEMAERLMHFPGIKLAQPNVRTGEVPLMLAMEKGMVELARTLIQKLDNPVLMQADAKGRTPLHIAARCNLQEVFQDLYKKLNQDGAIAGQLTRRDATGRTIFASAYLPKNARLGRVFTKSDNAMFEFVLDCTKSSLSTEHYTELEREIDALAGAKKIDPERNIKLRTLLNSKRNG